ncbi:MAG: VanW family protein [Armatimonadetes bacterium]|nr:VanW family protein [Armatimonadota bacterium]
MSVDRFQASPVTRNTPSRIGSFGFGLKVKANQARRLVLNALHPVPRLDQVGEALPTELLAESRSRLYVTNDTREQALELGKVHNLRAACRRLDRTRIDAGETFSFWRQLGRTTRCKGFVKGRQLQEGCLVPARGGGLCQLSNALYQAALEAGLEICERHCHTRIVPGSEAAVGRDATVAWNHIDLRFQSEHDVVLETKLTATELIVRLWGSHPPAKSVLPLRREMSQLKMARGCDSCGETECHRHQPGQEAHTMTAALHGPLPSEFLSFVGTAGIKAYVPRTESSQDSAARAFPLLSLWRSVGLRFRSNSPPQRRAFELKADRSLALAMARALGPEATHIVIDVRYLATLWREGVLGGRTYDVLLTRWPLRLIHGRLDEAAEKNPDRVLLSDFRAREEEVDAEWAAIQGADRVFTAHSYVAKELGPNVEKLAWALPERAPVQAGKVVAFPGPTAARKGAHDVRQALRETGAHARILGSQLEGPGFWDDVKVVPVRPGEHWLEGVGLVVAPSEVEERPHRLLEALACGVPVVTTRFSGLEGQQGVTIVEPGDIGALVDAIEALVSRTSTVD